MRKYLGKRLFWRLRGWNCNIKVGSKGLSYDYVLWIELVLNKSPMAGLSDSAFDPSGSIARQ